MRLAILKVENLFLLLNCAIVLTSAKFQPGLRGVCFYTHDDSFTGSDLVVQELKGQALDKLFANKEFLSKPKPLQTSYDFLSLLDGRCEVQLKCEKKECAKVIEKTCPPKETCPACLKCESCSPRSCTTCPQQQCEKTTTPSTTTKTTTRPTTTTTRTTPTTTTPTKTTTTKTTTTTRPTTTTTKTPTKITTTKTTSKTTTTTRPTTTTTKTTTTTSKTTPTTPKITTPTTSKPSTTTTTRTTTGRGYLPQSTGSRTTFEPWTGTYVANTGTFRQSNTWEPYTHTGSWKSRNPGSQSTFTTTPRYSPEIPKVTAKYN